VKQSILWVFVALLLGMSLFGFYKAWELQNKNTILSKEVSGLKIDLIATHKDLKQTKIKNEGLEENLNVLGTKFARAKQEIEKNKKSIVFLSEGLKDAKEINDFLAMQSHGIAEQAVRLKFENDEMKKTLSSVSELKKAIAKLRNKPKAKNERINRRPAPKKQKAGKKNVKLPVAPKPSDVALEGNQGFVVKDGKTTLIENVAIKVVPAEVNVF